MPQYLCIPKFLVSLQINNSLPQQACWKDTVTIKDIETQPVSTVLISAREKLTVCDVTNLPRHMDIN